MIYRKNLDNVIHFVAKLPAKIHEFKEVFVDRSRQLNGLNEVWPEETLDLFKYVPRFYISREAQVSQRKVESMAIGFYLATKSYRVTQKYIEFVPSTLKIICLWPKSAEQT